VRHLIPFMILFVVLGVCPAFSNDLPVDYDDVAFDMGPREIHQWLWENELRPELARLQEAAKLAADKTATNWQDYDMRYYNINLNIDDVLQTINGAVGTYGVVTASAIDFVAVNLLMAMNVDSVISGGTPLTFLHDEDMLTVYLDRSYSYGEEFVFTIYYHGTPAGSESFLGFDFTSRNGLPLITTLSEPYGSRSWWPCNDIPRDKVDSVDIIVTVDASLIVSSNGIVISDTDNGDGTHTTHWKSRYPIAPYLVSLGIHPYAVWGDWYHYSPSDSMPLQFHVYPDHDTYSRPFFGVLPEMIGLLADRLGEYPFINEKYGLTHFNWQGAMEHQTNTSTTSSSFGYTDDVISHELGHQWFGDMITCDDWHNIWINEGFATYCEALYHEAKFGTAYYHNYMNNFEYTGGGTIYIDDTTDVWTVFGTIVYDKGAWVLHMLRHVVGDDDFFQGLADYRSQYQWSSATIEDFQNVFETTTGMDLDWFFDEWIYGTFRPSYRYSWVKESDPAGGFNTYLHLNQIQSSDPQVFTMPIDIVLTTSYGEETVTIFNNQRSQNFILHTGHSPTDLDLDPDRWISRVAGLETYTFHIITPELNSGIQLDPYVDTVRAKGGTNDYACEIINGALPAGLTLAPSGILSGQPTEYGDFTFTVRATDQQYPLFADSLEYTISISQIADRPGDANGDGEVNVGDAVYIVNYIFKGGPAPLIMNWGDANGDCVINVGDAVYLVNYIFKGSAAPVLGCVE